MHFHGLTPDDIFPPMQDHPSYEELIACLNLMGGSASVSSTSSSSSDDQTPADYSPVWDCTVTRDEIDEYHASSPAALRAQRQATAVARYLGSIVMSDLAWIPDEDHREVLWATASRRIAERCGRTAMGDITRRWPLAVGGPGQQVDLILKEPALVGDSLGFKTWGTSYAMARMLPALAAGPHMSHLGLDDDEYDNVGEDTEDGVNILELGAGTGLLGLAAAALWRRADVVLTDLPDILPNLAANVQRNAAAIRMQGRGGQARATGALTWGAKLGEVGSSTGSEDDYSNSRELLVDPALFACPHTFRVVMAADPLYDEDHPDLLAGAVDDHLALRKTDPSARAVVMVPLRDTTTVGLADAFVAAMASHGLGVADEGEIVGQDSDWGGYGGGKEAGSTGPGVEFTCRWWVFRRSE